MSEIKITLSFGQRRFLLMLADRGRRVTMYLTASATGQDAVDGVNKMAEMGLVRITPLVGSDQSEVELLDFGAQVVTQMKQKLKAEVAQARNEGSEG